MDVWNEFGVEPKFGQNKPCSDKPLFFHNLGKKHRNRGFKWIWNRFGASKYLVIWTFEEIDELQQAHNKKNLSEKLNSFVSKWVAT